MDLLDQLFARVRRQEERLASLRQVEQRWREIDDLCHPLALDLMAEWLRQQVAYFGASGVVFGCSGGVDSTLIAVLVKKALPDACRAYLMPDANSDAADEAEGRALLDLLQIPHEVIHLGDGIDALLAQMHSERGEGTRRNVGNMASRLRVAALFFKSREINSLVVGTGDLDEAYIGYSSKGLAADLHPITGLHKDEVRALVYAHLAPLNEALARRLSERPASPGFWPGQRSEDQIGMEYSRVGRAVDLIRKHCQIGLGGVFPRNVEAFLKDLPESGVPPQDLLAVVDLMVQNYDTAYGSPALWRPAACQAPFQQEVRV